MGRSTPFRSTDRRLEVLGSPNIPPAPSTPVPGDSDVLLPPASPDQPSLPAVPRIRHSHPTVRVITPINTSEHPLASGSDYLSPPNRHRPRPAVPTPLTLDLPTRADVLAMDAIARAEQSGLRGGWVMNLEAGGRAYRKSTDSEMVDIDLEGGKGEVFGSPRVSGQNMVEKHSPRLISTRSPSPAEMTPRATSREEATPVPPSVLAATKALRGSSPKEMNSGTIPVDHVDGEVRHAGPLGRTTRESSVMSLDSHDGLLDANSHSHSHSQVRRSDPPVTMTEAEDDGRPSMRSVGSGVKVGKVGPEVDAGREDSMEEVSLDAVGGQEGKGVVVEEVGRHNVLGTVR